MKIIYRSNIVVILLSYILFLSLVWAYPPDWQDDPGAYQLIASTTCIILSDGVNIAEEGDILAAFDDDGNVRGVADEALGQLSASFGPYEGEIFYSISLRSNAEDDLLSFKYYDASEDVVLDIAEIYEFASNDIVGDLLEPVFYNIGCVDYAAGDYSMGCETIISWVGCDSEYSGYPVSYICPVSCDACSADCEANGPTSHGCCLDDFTLFLSSDGSVLYNTSEAIGGFQFVVEGDGVVVTGASGGAGEAAGFSIDSNSETNKVLGFSLTNDPILPGCGTLVEVELDGISTGLINLVISDPVGGGLEFEDVNCGDDGSNCLEIMRHLLPDEFGINKIYPNPFNPVTQIQYDISTYVFVKVQVFDIQGREVALLMNEYQSPGRYNITWHAGNHASGMYFVEMMIRHGDDLTIFSDMNKILFLK